MSNELWRQLDDYFADLLLVEDASLAAVLEASNRAGLPAHQVSPLQGKLLHLLSRMQRAKRILEIGTLGGYSGVWLARGLSDDGRLVTLEADARHAEVAGRNFAVAGVAAKVDIIEGKALETLPMIADGLEAPFDLAFIDADKATTVEYFDWALRLSREGSVIVVDNVVRGGDVIDDKSVDPDVLGIRRFNAHLAQVSTVSATAIQTVGRKGYDGFVISLVERAEPVDSS